MLHLLLLLQFLVLHSQSLLPSVVAIDLPVALPFRMALLSWTPRSPVALTLACMSPQFFTGVPIAGAWFPSLWLCQVAVVLWALRPLDVIHFASWIYLVSDGTFTRSVHGALSFVRILCVHVVVHCTFPALPLFCRIWRSCPVLPAPSLPSVAPPLACAAPFDVVVALLCVATLPRRSRSVVLYRCSHVIVRCTFWCCRCLSI